MRTFNIAVVGCGGVSRMHFPGYLAHPERVRVVAACDVIEERAQKAKAQYGLEWAGPSVEAMIDAGGWDVAAVCTPTPVREQVVAALAAAGKHVYCEKPMADNFAEAERMAAACDAAGVGLAVDQNLRYHYAFDIARSVIAEGRLGRVLTVAHQELMTRQDTGWRIECPRHALAVMGVHWLDGFRWMLGSEAKSIACHTHSSPAIDCAGETDAVAQIEFEDGAAVSYVESFSSPVGRAETAVVGERGVLVFGFDTAALYDRDHRREPLERWANPFAGPGKPESAFKGLDHLLAALEDGAEPPNSGHDNLKTVALLEGAYRSAKENRPVSFHNGLLA